jgi:hypothetical protein
MRNRSILTMSSAVARRQVLQVDTGRKAELVKVKQCTGVGPFQVTVRPLTRLDRAGSWLLRWPRWLRRKARDWWLDRCEARFCMRKYVVEDADLDGWCWKHADDALTEWLETTPDEDDDD